MRVVYLIQREAPPSRDGAPLVVAISDWDGVHRGHAALARLAAELASAHNGYAVALLPWPSPEGDDDTPATRLTTLEERIARLDTLGCFETLYILPTPPEPQDAESVLAWLRSLGNVQTTLGEPQRGGAVGQVWPAAITSALWAAGMIVIEQVAWDAVADEAPPQNTDSHSLSDLSAEIRALVAAGRIREATAALGYTYTVTGEVVGGDRRGRLLGFPTANLRPEPSKLVPANGIYAAWACLPGGEAPWPAVVSIGVRPTFGEGARRQVEAYLLDATMDLYGVQLRLEFVDYLRAELRFESVEALIAQMRADCEHARQTLHAETALDANAAG
jgi:riboflavin kinase / FMN adenylyltransferase